MSVEMRVGRDGKLRPMWYGRYEVNGRRVAVNLGVRIKGTPPESGSLRDLGDTAFEMSRAKARERLDSVISEVRQKQHSAHLVERMYEIKTGEKIQTIELSDLPKEWARIPRKRKPNARYAAQCQSTLARFANFVRRRNPKAREITHITRTLAREFMQAEDARGVTAKTWNDSLKLIRATLKHVLPAGAVNPFSAIPTRDAETVFRKPFNPEELRAILESSVEDDFIRPIIITGICTAMRRGDCCMLKWRDVDLQQRFITVKMSKTGQTVSIPIFPMLWDELAARKQTGEYVFPEQAAMYRANADGITWRVQKVLTTAFMTEADNTALPKLPEKETRRRVDEYLASLPATEKTERMRRVSKMYIDGTPSKDIVATTGVSKGSVSHYLNQIEAGVRCRIVLGRHDKATTAARIRTDRTILHTQRERGTRRASTRDFHSFRVTWVTIALTAGVPLELVQKVTGHRTTDVVLKHYFQPGREDFRRALESAMPRLLMNGEKTREQEAIEIITRMTAKSLARDKKRLLELLPSRGSDLGHQGARSG